MWLGRITNSRCKYTALQTRRTEGEAQIYATFLVYETSESLGVSSLDFTHKYDKDI